MTVLRTVRAATGFSAEKRIPNVYFTVHYVDCSFLFRRRDSMGAVVNDSPADCQSRDRLFRRKANPERHITTGFRRVCGRHGHYAHRAHNAHHARTPLNREKTTRVCAVHRGIPLLTITAYRCLYFLMIMLSLSAPTDTYVTEQPICFSINSTYAFA